jgi:hypothetical protein
MSAVAPDSLTFRYQFPGLPIVRVSDAGNLLRFEGPTGYDHVGVGAIGEGYVLCYGATVAYDTGSSQSGWGAPTNSCSGSTCTFNRTTSDGRMRLKQTISKNTTDRLVAIEMSLTNLGPGSIGGVILRRQIDLDVDTGGASGSGDFTNWFATTERDSVFAWNANNDHAKEDHAVVMRHIGKSPGTPLHQPKVTSAILDNSCNPTNIAAAAPVNGDYGATIQYNFGTMTADPAFNSTIDSLRCWQRSVFVFRSHNCSQSRLVAISGRTPGACKRGRAASCAGSGATSTIEARLRKLRFW